MIKRINLTKYEDTYCDAYFCRVICANAVYEYYGISPENITLVISSRARKDYYKVYCDDDWVNSLMVEGEDKARAIYPSLDDLLIEFPSPCYIGVEY